MARAPAYEPILDQVAVVELVDPEPGSIRHLQRIDQRVHALHTGWGGTGIWVPVHMDDSETPDDVVINVPLPSGVEYFGVRALVSHRDKVSPANCEATITSTATGSSTKLTWQESGAGDTLEGAFEIGTEGAPGEENGPLQCASGGSWAWDVDTLTIVFDTGKGTIWGILLSPIHTTR